jgi:CRISPR/Cas system Type II protein with McrA/HNH and RuvC-like nuclease domain
VLTRLVHAWRWRRLKRRVRRDYRRRHKRVYAIERLIALTPPYAPRNGQVHVGSTARPSE